MPSTKSPSQQAARWCSEHSSRLVYVGGLVGLAVCLLWVSTIYYTRDFFLHDDNLLSEQNIKIVSAILLLVLLVTITAGGLFFEEKCVHLWPVLCFLGILLTLTAMLMTNRPNIAEITKKYSPENNNITLIAPWWDRVQSQGCCGIDLGHNQTVNIHVDKDQAKYRKSCCATQQLPAEETTQKPSTSITTPQPSTEKNYCDSNGIYQDKCNAIINSKWDTYIISLGLTSLSFVYLFGVHLVLITKKFWYSQANSDSEA